MKAFKAFITFNGKITFEGGKNEEGYGKEDMQILKFKTFIRVKWHVTVTYLRGKSLSIG